MHGVVVSLHTKLEPGRMAAAESLQLVDGQGIEGDFHFGSADRQVLLLDESTLSEFGYSPGQLREQILVSLPDLQSIAIGSRVRVGDAVIEITMDCRPCLHMAEEVGEDGREFVDKLMGRRGMLGKVVEGGNVSPGDPVVAEVPASA